MHILIKNKYITYGNYKVKCAVGKRGIKKKKKEGDLSTPKGTFQVKKVYYRHDKVKNLKTCFKKIVIRKNMGWCDDPRSNRYNKLIKYPFKYKSEKLFRADNTYDIILVLNFNMNPVKKNKGSAIFIHIAKKGFQPTQGCIALNKSEMIKLVKSIKKNTVVKIT